MYQFQSTSHDFYFLNCANLSFLRKLPYNRPAKNQFTSRVNLLHNGTYFYRAVVNTWDPKCWNLQHIRSSLNVWGPDRYNLHHVWSSLNLWDLKYCNLQHISTALCPTHPPSTCLRPPPPRAHSLAPWTETMHDRNSIISKFAETNMCSISGTGFTYARGRSTGVPRGCRKTHLNFGPFSRATKTENYTQNTHKPSKCKLNIFEFKLQRKLVLCSPSVSKRSFLHNRIPDPDVRFAKQSMETVLENTYFVQCSRATLKTQIRH